LWKDIGLIIFAFVGLTSGTFASMKDIIATFSASSNGTEIINGTMQQS
jgi:uncharacterized membrane protein